MTQRELPAKPNKLLGFAGAGPSQLTQLGACPPLLRGAKSFYCSDVEAIADLNLKPAEARSPYKNGSKPNGLGSVVTPRFLRVVGRESWPWVTFGASQLCWHLSP